MTGAGAEIGDVLAWRSGALLGEGSEAGGASCAVDVTMLGARNGPCKGVGCVVSVGEEN